MFVLYFRPLRKSQASACSGGIIGRRGGGVCKEICPERLRVRATCLLSAQLACRSAGQQVAPVARTLSPTHHRDRTQASRQLARPFADRQILGARRALEGSTARRPRSTMGGRPICRSAGKQPLPHHWRAAIQCIVSFSPFFRLPSWRNPCQPHPRSGRRSKRDC